LNDVQAVAVGKDYAFAIPAVEIVEWNRILGQNGRRGRRVRIEFPKSVQIGSVHQWGSGSAVTVRVPKSKS